MKKKYIQKILDLYAELKPHRDFENMVIGISFYDGTREKIITRTRQDWKFYESNKAETGSQSDDLRTSS